MAASTTHTLMVVGTTGPRGDYQEGPLTNTVTAGIYSSSSQLTTGSFAALTLTPPATATILRITVPTWPASPHDVIIEQNSGDTTGWNLGTLFQFAEIPIKAATANIYIKGANGTNHVTAFYSFE